MGKRALFGFIYAGGLIGILGFTPHGTYILAFFTLLLLNEVARILDVQSRLPLLTFTSLFLLEEQLEIGADQKKLSAPP